MTSNQNNSNSFDKQNKIRNTNLYHVLQDIEKEYPPIQDVNDIDNAEDYISYHIVGLQNKNYLHRDGITKLFHKMNKQTRTECCPLMINDCSSIIYIDLDYKIISNENNQDMVEKFNKDISKGIINNFKSIVHEDTKPVYVTLFPSVINYDEKNKYYKCGAHCFIFFDRYISKKEYRTKLVSKIDNDEELNKIFDKFKDSIQLDESKELKVSSLIDILRFIADGSIIFPLAQKDVNSR